MKSTIADLSLIEWGVILAIAAVGVAWANVATGVAVVGFGLLAAAAVRGEL